MGAIMGAVADGTSGAVGKPAVVVGPKGATAGASGTWIGAVTTGAVMGVVT
jgi:hypothetical protein